MKWRGPIVGPVVKLVACLVACLMSGWASAHPMDEMVQAAYLKLEPTGLELELDLTPGELVAPRMLTLIDQNRNGQLEPTEVRAYAGRVLGQLQIRSDGQTRPLKLISTNTPKIAAFMAGGGTIQILARTTWPERAGSHTLEFQNAHAPVRSGYLSNAFVQSERLQMSRQSRNPDQTQYRLEYDLERAAPVLNLSEFLRWWPLLLVAVALAIVVTFRWSLL